MPTHQVKVYHVLKKSIDTHARYINLTLMYSQTIKNPNPSFVITEQFIFIYPNYCFWGISKCHTLKNTLYASNSMQYVAYHTL